jgi:hypothetical protein
MDMLSDSVLRLKDTEVIMKDASYELSKGISDLKPLGAENHELHLPQYRKAMMRVDEEEQNGLQRTRERIILV